MISPDHLPAFPRPLESCPPATASLLDTLARGAPAAWWVTSLTIGPLHGPKAAVVEGAVTVGGLTVIANAPNPAGQALLAAAAFRLL